MTQEYIGTKQVTAYEQSGPKKIKVCGVDCKQGGASCNKYCTGESDHPPAADVQPGYAVKYPDGYVSWSPKAVFEAAYLAIGHIGHMPAHQQRVIGEKAQLDDRLAKLAGFIDTPVFAGLPEAEQGRLLRQSIAMRDYAAALSERIEAF